MPCHDTSTSQFKTSKDYSNLCLAELFEELFLACQDIVNYKEKMNKEYEELRKEISFFMKK